MIQTRNKVVLIGCALLTVVFAAAPAHGHRALPLHLPDSLVDGPKLPMDEIEPPSVPGELLVRFKSGVGRERTQHVLQSHGAMRARELAAFDVHKVKLRPGVTVAEAAEDLNDNPLVKEAIPNYELSPAESIPDDTDFSGLWSLRNVGQEHP
ncbi:MAG TPA: hypothetical protein VE975_02340, partial [Actinomycetota bacterium]|nr:hypothetical protein [Actinomycetota bacterium]